MTAELRLVDPDTGELVAPGCRQCHELTAKVAGLEGDLEALMKQLAATIRQRDANKKARAAEREAHPRRKECELVFADWREITGKTNSNLGTRQDKIVARLNEGYTREHFRLAAYGAMHNNPWLKRGEKPLVEIGTYARKSEWLEQFANAGAEWLKRTGPETNVRVKCGTQESPRDETTSAGTATRSTPL